jgi:hypothetical protein
VTAVKFKTAVVFRQSPFFFIADAEKRHLDFGHYLLRLPDENDRPTL